MKYRRSVSLSARTYLALRKASAASGDAIAGIVTMAVDEYLSSLDVKVSDEEVSEWKRSEQRRKVEAAERRREQAIVAAEAFGVRGVG